MISLEKKLLKKRENSDKKTANKDLIISKKVNDHYKLNEQKEYNIMLKTKLKEGLKSSVDTKNRIKTQNAQIRKEQKVINEQLIKMKSEHEMANKKEKREFICESTKLYKEKQIMSQMNKKSTIKEYLTKMIDIEKKKNLEIEESISTLLADEKNLFKQLSNIQTMNDFCKNL